MQLATAWCSQTLSWMSQWTFSKLTCAAPTMIDWKCSMQSFVTSLSAFPMYFVFRTATCMASRRHTTGAWTHQWRMSFVESSAQTQNFRLMQQCSWLRHERHCVLGLKHGHATFPRCRLRCPRFGRRQRWSVPWSARQACPWHPSHAAPLGNEDRAAETEGEVTGDK